MQDGKTIRLEVNGQARQVRAAMTLAGLIEELALQPQQVAVERNQRLVRRADHATTRLEDGDRLEIVTFLGGG